MVLFLIALAAIGLSALASIPLALQKDAALANKAGAGGVFCGCALGFAAAIIGLGSEPAQAVLPWGLPFGACVIGLDQLSRLFLLPVFGLGAICAASGMLYLAHYKQNEHNIGAHWFFYAMLVLGLALTICARDAVMFLLSWEIMSLAPFFLIEFHDSERPVRDASRIYLIAAHLGAVFLLFFFAYASSIAGSTSFADMTAAGNKIFGSGQAGWLASLLFVCALLGFGAKAGLSPLHVWLPEAHPAAPSHVSALLSGAMINAGLYGFIRSLEFMGPVKSMPEWWGWLLLFAGLGAGVTGILKALAQYNLKSLLAYSSVENMGIMFMGVGAGLIGAKTDLPFIASLGFGAAILHMLNHSAFKGLLFLCAGEILHAAHTVHMEFLGGLQKRMPAVGLAFGVGAAAIACLPPLNGFAGEFVLAVALAEGIYFPALEGQIGLLSALVGLAAISGLAAAVYAKAYGVIFLGEARTGAAANCTPPEKPSLIILAVPAVVCVAAGLGAPFMLDLIIPASSHIIKSLGGIYSTALSGQVTDNAANILYEIILLGMAAIALAVCFAALRRRLLRKNGIRKWKTWDCGYIAGTSRMQYTGASFSEPLSNIFGSGMGLTSRQGMDKGYFPAKGSLDISTFDRLKSIVFIPLFEAIRRACDAAKIIQHGKIHLYILYILVTAVLLLFWGLSS